IADDPMVDDTLDRLQTAANHGRFVFDDHDKTDRLHVSSGSARRRRALFAGSSKTLFARRRQANGQLSGSWEGKCVGGRAARESGGPADPAGERPALRGLGRRSFLSFSRLRGKDEITTAPTFSASRCSAERGPR